MFRTENSVGMLKSIAMIAGLAILLWSLGLPSLRFADAANVSAFSDTITDSAPSATIVDHEIAFTATDGLAAGETLTVEFPAGFGLGSITEDDLDLDVDGTPVLTDTVAASGLTWQAAVSGQTITFTSGTDVINALETVVIRIGVNAVDSGTGANQISNPSSEGSYEIILGGSMSDSGFTRVVILTAVTVSAAVDTIFTFAVAGTGAGAELSAGGETTTGVAASTSVPFGTLTELAASSSAHLLSVSTNASNGYVVTVQVDGALQSSTGADIDDLSTGDTPTNWPSPTSPTLGDESTYGWWGISSDDVSIASRGTQFVAGQFIGATTTPRAVMGNAGPANAVGVGVGTTTVGFKVEISSLQEAGDDYTTTLTYVATPTF